jgi:hypothetical protein
MCAPELAVVLDPRLGLASRLFLVMLGDLREVRSHRISRAWYRGAIGTQKAFKNAPITPSSAVSADGGVCDGTALIVFFICMFYCGPL